MNKQLFVQRQGKINVAQPMPPFIRELRDKIRDGEKTQTRRVIDPQPSSGVRKSPFVSSGFEDGHGVEIKPKYPDALRYLREPLRKGAGNVAYYKDDDILVLDAHGKPIEWRWQRDSLPQIFMPKEAARHFVDWHVYRLQEIQAIDVNDIRAEGVRGILKDLFIELWDQINADRGFPFRLNPFVWAYEFHLNASYHWDPILWKIPLAPEEVTNG